MNVTGVAFAPHFLYTRKVVCRKPTIYLPLGAKAENLRTSEV
jgi:hypothetical protein